MKKIALACLALSGCATSPADPQPSDRFLSHVQALCGKAYEGRIVSPPSEADAAFSGKRLVMHVRGCSTDGVRIPFHVGEDRSRTWVITRTDGGLQLKHDHRYADGTEDKLSQYGGDAIAGGSAARQSFPADAFSRAMFARQNIPASTANVWAMEVHPGRMFAYELRRPGRFFRVEFDLARAVQPPPAPWGAN